MNLATARDWAKSFVRDASKENKPNVDRAIRLACSEFVKISKCVTVAGSVTLTANSAVFNVSALLATGFRSDRFIDCYVDGYANPITVVDYPALNEMIVCGTSASPTPTHVAFPTPLSNGKLFPTPGATLTATLRYNQPFGITVSGTFAESWTEGTDDADTLAGVLNVEEDYIMPVLAQGAAAILKAPTPEAAYGSREWAKFVAYCGQSLGAASTGGSSIQRRSSRDLRRRPRRVIYESY